MVVSIDKATAVRMYDKVRRLWDERLARGRARLLDPAFDGEERDLLAAEVDYLTATDMAVVVSQGQNEILEMSRKGLDIEPHRRRMVTEDLEGKFKDATDPLRIVFVCAMWTTGFDVPSCSTIYLDKPMKNHTLMQTIARANRVFPEKANGLIVDYIGVFRNLEAALAIYAAPKGGGDDLPVKDKEELVSWLRSAIDNAVGFCRDHGVDIHAVPAAKGFDRIAGGEEAVEQLIVDDDTKVAFVAHARLVEFTENLDEEQLAVYDMLMRPAPELTDVERKEQQARAAVRLAVEETLDELPEKFTTDLYEQKCDAVYQHVFDSYWDDGHSVYEPASSHA